MISADTASAYFRTSTRRREWEDFSPEQQSAAVDMAKRDLSRALGRPMDEDEEPYAYGDQTRDEFAVYEQALYVLLRDAMPLAPRGSDVPPLDGDERRPAASTLGEGRGKWSAEALAWLGVSNRVETVLG